MFGSEVMQPDARGFDNKGIYYSSHKVKKTGDVAIKNNGRDAPEFLVYGGLMMLHHPLICELTAVVLYDQDLMGDQLKQLQLRTLVSGSLMPAGWTAPT